ncbi:MAG: UDP-N-acetylglucosamine 2-epimerase (non-hydrolyzing) [Sphingomonadales bacterium]|nr:UDP-N-acetylglucosamine 2-epimerase (non-hydrolyzing) [Sphingomonadales bacterium]
MLKTAVVMGTRPEAIKLAPIIARLRRTPTMAVAVIDTGQQPAAFNATAAAFSLNADYALGVHRAEQTLADLTADLLAALEATLRELSPDLVIVQGDTQSALTGAMAAARLHIPVAHVEAGLRTGNLEAPFPEEINRRVIAGLTALHFAPTPWARGNLLREGIPNQAIAVTGNPIIDSLATCLEDMAPIGKQESWRRVLVTCHRRESWNRALPSIATAVRRLADRQADVMITVILPIAPTPRRVLEQILKSHSRIRFAPPLAYTMFLRELLAADLVISDSGGILEEAASLGISTAIIRDQVDRPEALELPWIRLAGTEENAILDAAGALLRQPRYRIDLCAGPFGDGKAAKRIVKAILRWRRGAGSLLSWRDEFHPPNQNASRHGRAV